MKTTQNNSISHWLNDQKRVYPVIIDPSFQKPEKPIKLEKLKINKIDSTTYAFASSEGDVVEIGTKTHSPAVPYVKLNKWNGEASVSVSLPTDTQKELKLEDGKVKWIEDKREIHIYPLEPREIIENKHKVKQLDNGGLEFEIVLKEKPTSNKIVLNIETKGLKYYYQPPLNQENHDSRIVSCTETDCYDKDDNVINHRPENVVGSYAVYHTTKKNHIIGQMNYKTGKAFHIYRPRINDSAGNEVWGELNIDKKKGVLTVEISQEFLDTAVYPVRHAAGLTFGYEEVGGSDASTDKDNINAIYPFAPESSGTITNIMAYCFVDDADANTARGVIYKESDDTLVAVGSESFHAIGPESFQEYPLSGTVTEGTNYMLGVWAKVSFYVSYDTGTNYDWAREAETYHETNNPPSPCGWSEGKPKYSGYVLSIYATYTAGGGGEGGSGGDISFQNLALDNLKTEKHAEEEPAGFCVGDAGDRNSTGIIEGDVVYCDNSDRMWSQTLASGYEWGCYGTTISGADSDTDGKQNTADILADCTSGSRAAEGCDSLDYAGFTDWWLPAKDTLSALYPVCDDGVCDTDCSWDDYCGCSGANFRWYYWSSTQINTSIAWYVMFDSGNVGNYYDKRNSLNVRCVRQ